MKNNNRSNVPDTLTQLLASRSENGGLRKLVDQSALLDFSSNDYLGLSRNRELFEKITARVKKEGVLPNGGTGSRLISGNHHFYQEVEEYLSDVFEAESCLLFNSGYNANQAVVASIPQKGDTVLYDQLAHVCLKEGAWLSKASSFSFKHNDLEDLERRLKGAEGTIYVVTETVFSMDGDCAPLQEMIVLCERYNAWLIVDEAHSTGTYGSRGAGWLVEKQLHDRILARIYTFGKGMGVHGACVAGSRALIAYMINFGRPFIYTTSLPPHSVISIHESFLFLSQNEWLQDALKERIGLFKNEFSLSKSSTAIQPVMISGNEKAKEAANDLQTKGMDIRAILAPTIRVGTERLRISLHVHNSEKEIKQLCVVLDEVVVA